MKKLATILIVDAIEPVLSFWTETLGFKVTQQVGEGRLDFVMLEANGIEVHLQTREVTKKMAPNLPEFGKVPGCVLYFDVEDLDSLEENLIRLSNTGKVKILIPKHKTFYGATELYAQEPGGHIVGFAQI